MSQAGGGGGGFPSGSVVKIPPANAGDPVHSLED